VLALGCRWRGGYEIGAHVNWSGAASSGNIPDVKRRLRKKRRDEKQRETAVNRPWNDAATSSAGQGAATASPGLGRADVLGSTL